MSNPVGPHDQVFVLGEDRDWKWFPQDQEYPLVKIVNDTNHRIVFSAIIKPGDVEIKIHVIG